ncbi:uncharacterized protein LOC106181389 [Lingula anatina]|uniref:Copper transport protein n=1 Tax=Lingula anatina TaxID=7574 RepID=A0A1S3KFI0_LINAN|nr:uncharacterized protein LOC106181389 [Lingula anatina]|eukprot:XP_013421214.1 uncharacterized protein LOC106181389 [Lingula anatina]
MNMTEKHRYDMFSTSNILKFHVGTGETLFFEKWLVSQDKQFLVTCVAVFFLAFFHEGLKALVDYVKMSRDRVYDATQSATVRQTSEKDKTEKTGNAESMGHEPR